MDVAYNIKEFQIKLNDIDQINIKFTCEEERFYRFPSNMTHRIVFGGMFHNNIITDELLLDTLLSPYAKHILKYIWNLCGVETIFLLRPFNNSYEMDVKFNPYISYNHILAEAIMSIFNNEMSLLTILIGMQRSNIDKRYFKVETLQDESVFHVYFHHLLTKNKRSHLILSNYNDCNQSKLTRYGREKFAYFKQFFSMVSNDEHINRFVIRPYCFTIFYNSDANAEYISLVRRLYPHLELGLFLYELNNQKYLDYAGRLFIE